MSPVDNTFGELGLSIIGVGVQYPRYNLAPDDLETLSKRFYARTPSMNKVLSINRFTGIENRSSIGTIDHPLVNQETAPSVSQLHEVFVEDGVPLAITASQKAIEESRIRLSDITHVVSTTCTNNANPGFDNLVVAGLGIKQQVEKVLLQGVGCSGGLAVLRTASNLALGRTAQRKPARILCVALELCTPLVRSEFDSINELQEVRIGPALFSDCASAVILSNDLGGYVEPIYDVLGWDHRVIPDTAEHLRFDSDPLGWKVVLTPDVPKVACAAVPEAFSDILASVPSIPRSLKNAEDFDWALHPGGATILTGTEKEMGITPYHLRASYDTYMKHGNSSSATIFSVLNRLRAKDMDAIAPSGGPREFVMACAFGPGVSVEMCALRRSQNSQRVADCLTPPLDDPDLD
ncbi:unnamed protein product [Clonostachys rosea f. rosea IK726]|uniref:Uncharacterized protein n=3 Tax=Bionectria ochroleuca TaxID=29856 RepID=A0A0B7KCS3_BIOOC|nr:unnamed protein product [Clonostachys rosea f. rosea IK726]CAG9956863.1 unnamed protein product [Clonostachys rosea f. rosea IK726]